MNETDNLLKIPGNCLVAGGATLLDTNAVHIMCALIATRGLKSDVELGMEAYRLAIVLLGVRSYHAKQYGNNI